MNINRKRRPIIGITMGDPAGIGPEIIVKSLSNKEIYEMCEPLVIGDKNVILRALDIAKKDLKINYITSLNNRQSKFDTIDVFGLNRPSLSKIKHGEINPLAGKAAGDCIKIAIKLALKKKIDAMVTAPIHKKSLNLGGYHYPGHTEFCVLATKTKKYNMLLIHGKLKVIHVTTHVPLGKVSSLITKNRVLDTIRLANDACRLFGIRYPRIAVLGFNPHAGDDGLFGSEEEEAILPAIAEAQALGLNVDGPLVPDTTFAKAIGGKYDIVVAMYHDQGHIPLKLLGFSWNEKRQDWDAISGVNVTLGLPIIRTSVDHGVAFGKAGKGVASPKSLLEAIGIAVQLATYKRKKAI